MIRAPKPQELEPLLELIDQVFRIPQGRSATMGKEFPTLFCEENLPNLLTIWDGPRPQSHIGLCFRPLSFAGVQVLVGSMGAVCTDPTDRGKGLGTQLVHASFQRAQDVGAAFIYISGGRGLYRRNGSASTGEMSVFHLKPPELNPGDVELVPAQSPQDLQVYAELYAREPYRFQRSFKDLLRYHQAGPYWIGGARPRQIVLVRHHGVFTAGLVLEAGEGTQISEYCGDRQALAASASRLGVPQVQWPVPTWDIPMARGLDHQAYDRTQSNYPGTIVLTDLSKLGDLLLTWSLQRSEEPLRIQGNLDQMTLHWGEVQSGPMTKDLMAQALFGPLPADLPKPFHSLLPIPLPWAYGLNYI